MIALALMSAVALIPPPPPAPERTTPLPQYAAECRLVDSDAGTHPLTLVIAGRGLERQATIYWAEGALKGLRVEGQRPTVMSSGNSVQLWETTDAIAASLEGRNVTLWIEVGPDVSQGAHVRIFEKSSGLRVPLYSGMCRTNPAETGAAE